MSQRQESSPEYQMMVFAMWLVVLCLVVAGFMAWATRPELVDYVMDRDNNCQLISKHETEERLYCGKACTTPEWRHVFECPNRGKVLVDWYEITP